MKKQNKKKAIDLSYNLQLLRECFAEDIEVLLLVTKDRIRILKAESPLSKQLEQEEELQQDDRIPPTTSSKLKIKQYVG